MFYSWYVYLFNLTFDVSYLKWYILSSLLPVFSLQPLSLSHLTLSKCESCLPKKIEAIYCQIIDACHPGSISMRKARDFGDTCISSCKLGTSRSSYPFKRPCIGSPVPSPAHFVWSREVFVLCPITNLFGIGFYFAGERSHEIHHHEKSPLSGQYFKGTFAISIELASNLQQIQANHPQTNIQFMAQKFMVKMSPRCVCKLSPEDRLKTVVV